MRVPNSPLVLRHLRDHGLRSRARLAAELDLPRSAFAPGRRSRGARPRASRRDRARQPRTPGTAVERRREHRLRIGAEINVNHIATIALDLAGDVVAEHRSPSTRTGSRPPRSSTVSPRWSRRPSTDVRVTSHQVAGCVVGSPACSTARMRC